MFIVDERYRAKRGHSFFSFPFSLRKTTDEHFRIDGTNSRWLPVLIGLFPLASDQIYIELVDCKSVYILLSRDISRDCILPRR